MIKNYRVKLHVLSPIHIGMGDAYDPTQFVFDKDGLMYVFETSDYLKSLSNEKTSEFCKLTDDASNPIPVINFFRENFDKGKVKCRQIQASEDLLDRYLQICNSKTLNKEVINQFELRRTIFNSVKEVPYIPGSSIKGCLKTAWMNEEAKESNIKKGDKYIEEDTDNQKDYFKRHKQDVKQLEQEILNGSFNTDPFRFIKVSDFYPIENNNTILSEIKYAVMFPRNYSKEEDLKKKEERGKLTVAIEVISKGCIFEGVISINDVEKYKDIKNRRFLPSKYVTKDSLIKALKGYYAPKIQNENNLLKSLSAETIKIDNNINLFIRLGYHSGAEFVTIDNNRSIRITPPKVESPKYAERATTIWLASSYRKPDSAKDLQPFGWATLDFEEMN